ncbi:hypothetical protein GPUN_1217 [Glaciecola punicea ACAM 611]|jgi:hypothetical protein|uniref:Uncharacterized protein n=1 Tax=Glaciecola punicea ACAM 611 TaxID=1121923 RepID=H5TAL4_9ALTE|nr:hypothetical protein GPUN_1217 [Glaciecola punicea ACAM 611]
MAKVWVVEVQILSIVITFICSHHTIRQIEQQIKALEWLA